MFSTSRREKQTAQLPDLGGGVMMDAFSPDGSRIVVGSLDGTAQIWDATDGKLITVLRGHNFAVSLQHSAAMGRELLRHPRTARREFGMP